jgi:hypothetical protein
MQRLTRLVAVAALASFGYVAGCSAVGESGSYSDSGGGEGSPSAESGPGAIQPGTLTAGVWDDNQNFPWYLEYLASVEGQQSRPAGLPIVPRADRMTIDVVDASGNPLPGALVTVSAPGSSTELFSGPAGADGRVLFFPAWAGVAAGTSLAVRASAASAAAEETVQAGDPAVALRLTDTQAQAVRALDVALVIDATGSMGDEMEYLKVEFDGIVSSLAQRFTALDQRWALILYRDQGDEFVVRKFDFTGSASEFRATLAAQEANGGGDYAELPDVALGQAAELSWRGGATARALFHVADAPHHDGHELALLSAVQAARSRGIRIYPVAASGVDELAEFTMRLEAQLTGGRYLFLTDDSGVGGEHKEPSIPCYFVTKLNQAIVRMLSAEISGRMEEPAPEDIIRTAGDPQNGACTLESGQVVSVR